MGFNSKENCIPNNYDIEVVNLEGNWKVDSRIKESVAKMLKDARKEGLKPIICSAYRSSKEQEKLFDEKVKEYTKIGYSQKVAKEQETLWVTVPGTSEHELGLSLDIVGINYQILDENQEDTEIQKWLMEHCYEYDLF